MAPSVNRRNFLLGTAALSTMGLLAACGGGSSKSSGAASASALAAGGDISSLVSINAQDVSSLKQGGTFTLASTALGPDFNVASVNGYFTTNLIAMSPINSISTGGLWLTNSDGSHEVNKDYCESYEVAIVDGVQTHTIKLNPNAKFNDGTAIDASVLITVVDIMRDESGDYPITDPGDYPYIDTIEQGATAQDVIIKMKEPIYPDTGFFYGGTIVHPALKDPELYKNAFVDKINNDYLAGPFKVDQWNSSEKYLTMVPNENWWGDKPLLERITFKEMEASAARAAFKNGEIDIVGASSLSSYTELSGTAGTDIRRGQRLFTGGIMLNPARIPDVALRKAIFAGIDRNALAAVRFQGLNWSETMPGSMMLMPFSKFYQDNYPTPTGTDAAKKYLTDAGYTMDGEYFVKDGQRAKFAITIFGDDAVEKGSAQNLEQQMKACGIELSIDTQPSANYTKVIAGKEYDMTFTGYGVYADPVSAATYFYKSETNDVGSPEIDAMVEQIKKTADEAERNKLCNEVEKKFTQEFAVMGSYYNGPEIYVAKKELANYGSFLFGAPADNPDVWKKVGWMNA